MKQITFTFDKEEDYNEFVQQVVQPLPEKIGKIEENENVVHVIINDLQGDTK